MRVISGKHKGKRLQAPKNLPVRPTTDMAKEALFNIINNNYYFEDLAVLDLFAGTGSISIEFASRGTNQITAVESHIGCIKFINKIAKELQIDITTLKSDVFSFLKKSNSVYDFIFADPPYHFEKDKFLQIPQLIFEKKMLSENGMLVIEHSTHTDLSEFPNFKHLKKYGNSTFSFFEHNTL